VAVIVVGLNQRTVPLPVLETMTVLPADLGKVLHDLDDSAHIDEVAVLSTCMRTEVYAVASRFHGAMADVRNFLSTWSGLPPEAFSDHVYAYHDEAAVTHLFRVASGLDSAVLGEGEILGQVRQAWRAARDERTAGPALQALFRHAVEVGKRVRTETAISRGTTSLSQAAVALAADRAGGLGGRRVLVVGAGEMGEAIVRAAAAQVGDGRVMVANRTAERAARLARRYGGVAVPWLGIAPELQVADVLITSTGAPEVVFSAGDLEAAAAARGGRPLLVVDVAVPRDVDPGVREVAGVSLVDMDDLEAFAGAAMAERRQEVPAALEIVTAEAERYLELAAQRELVPLVVDLRARAEEIRQAELKRAAGRLGTLDDEQSRAVEALTRGLVAKLLHQPTVALKAAAGSQRGEALSQALRQLFDL
jgi:glutamyl-tRNA reductase